jgi:1,4-alpha-glucan branching enzyme
MLTDDLLKTRYSEHLDDLIVLSEKEIERTARSRTTSGWRRCTATASASCATPGAVTTATWCGLPQAAGLRPPGGDDLHGHARLLPADGSQLGAMRAQVHTAADLYEKHFGRRTRGMWLGECGYVPAWTSSCAKRACATSSSTHTACATRTRPPSTTCTRPCFAHGRGRLRA